MTPHYTNKLSAIRMHDVALESQKICVVWISSNSLLELFVCLYQKCKINTRYNLLRVIYLSRRERTTFQEFDDTLSDCLLHPMWVTSSNLKPICASSSADGKQNEQRKFDWNLQETLLDFAACVCMFILRNLHITPLNNWPWPDQTNALPSLM